MQWFITAVIVVALGLAAMAAAGGLGEMRKQPVRDYYHQDLPSERPLSAAEIGSIRFAVTLRGYSMAQVDDLLERLGTEIALRDARIAELVGAREPDSAPESEPEPEPEPVRDAEPVEVGES